MINQQLLEYIRAQLKAGAKKEDIKKMLTTGGWTQQDADEAFGAIEGVQVPPPMPKPMPAPTPAVMATMAATPAANLPDYKPASFSGGKAMPPVIVKKRSNWRIMLLIILLVFVLAIAGGIYLVSKYPSLAAYLPAPLQDWVTPAVSKPQTTDNATTSQAAPVSETYTNTAKSFSIVPPAGWKQIQAGVLGTDVLFTDASHLESGANINVISGSSTLSLAAYVDVSKQSLKKTLTNYAIVSEASTTIQGDQAYILNGTFKQGEQRLENLQLIVVHSGRWYVVTGSTLESAWTAYKDSIRTSLLTFTAL